MKKNNVILKIEILLVILLSACTFFRFTSNKIFIAFLLLLVALLLGYFFKKEKVLKSDKNKILKVLLVFSILYLALFYMMGLYTGYNKASNIFGLSTIIKYIIPFTVIIISTEYIRKKLLINDSLKSKALVVIITTFIDILLYINLYSADNLDSFLILLGFITFASVANNLLFTYLCSRYGIKSIIIYRLITTLYIYFIPYEPDVYVYFRTFIRMLFPLLIYLYLEKYYNSDKEATSKKDFRKQIISLIVGTCMIIAVIMLVSCKFYAGVLVIGSDSMTGTIDRGDVVFYIADKDNIKKSDVIVFERKDVRIVHRVINKLNINDSERYYTQGDANKYPDEFYVSQNEVIGKVLFKIKYIGKPTLWLRNVFDKEG